VVAYHACPLRRLQPVDSPVTRRRRAWGPSHTVSVRDGSPDDPRGPAGRPAHAAGMASAGPLHLPTRHDRMWRMQEPARMRKRDDRSLRPASRTGPQMRALL
jgi:hypothetical protein